MEEKPSPLWDAGDSIRVGGKSLHSSCFAEIERQKLARQIVTLARTYGRTVVTFRMLGDIFPQRDAHPYEIFADVLHRRNGGRSILDERTTDEKIADFCREHSLRYTPLWSQGDRGVFTDTTFGVRQEEAARRAEWERRYGALALPVDQTLEEAESTINAMREKQCVGKEEQGEEGKPSTC